MSDVDALFGGREETPKPRAALVAGLVFGGLSLAAFGLACSVIPGLGLVAWGWNLAEIDGARLATGYYGPERRVVVWIERIGSTLALLVGFGLLFLQAWLLWQGFYHLLWGALLAMLIAALPA